MAISGGDGSIVLTTKVDDAGLKKGTKSLRSEAMKLAAVYRKAGMSQSEAQKRAYKELGITAKETDKVTKKTKEFGNESEKSGSKASRAYGGVKSAISAMGRAFAVVGVAGLTAFAGITKAAVDSYAEYEQLKGGVETLFKDSAGQLMKYADQAYKTAGLSANEYMATVTSFSASLLQSLGGDTEKAANYADQAIIDMSDNANKMGTSMEMIQNAYQGFAKQNYTMLDNLKLGYGGTKEEMQRLLKDATKLSGIEYDISSFADVTEAIHVMQVEMGLSGYSADELKEKLSNMSLTTDEIKKVAEDMGITYEEAMAKMNDGTLTVNDAQTLLGTTAKEASTTIQGSANAMKASWQNLLTGMADPTQDFNALLQNFITSIGTFAGNLLPVIQTATQGVLQMVQGLLPQLGSMVSEMLPMVVEGASGIISGIVSATPMVVQAISGLLPELLTALGGIIGEVANQLPSVMQTIVSALPSVIESIVSVLPTLIPQVVSGISQAVTLLANNASSIIQPLIAALPDIIISIVDAIMTNLPLVIEGTISLVMAIVEAIPQIIDGIVQALPTVISLIISGLLKCLPQILAGLGMIVIGIVKSLPSIFASLIEGIGNIFIGIFNGIQETIAPIAEWFKKKFHEAKEKIGEAFKPVVDWFSGIYKDVQNVFKSVGNWFKTKFDEAVTGIKNAWSSVVSWFSGIWNSITGVFASVGSWFKTKFNEAVSGIKNAWSSIKSFFTSKWNEITGVFKNAKDKFLDIGKNIVAGIKQGIKNAWNNLKNWFSGLFGDLIGIAKKILGIKSPSREFMWIAEMIVAGLTKGIDKYGHLAIRGVKELSRNAVDVFKEIIPEMTKGILSDTRTEVQKVVDEMNEELLESERLYNEESERLKDSNLESDKEYLDNLKEIADKERKLYDARKKDVENLKETIVNAYSDMASKALDSISELQKTQESFAEKLAGYGDLTYEKTYRNKYGQQVTETFLEDPSKQTEFLEEYYDTLMKVKERGDIPQEFFATIRDMGIEEGFEYANALLELTDDDFDKYVKEWQRKQEASQNISKALYADEASDLATSINNEFDDLKDDMFDIGKDSAGEFGDGFIQQLKFLAHDIRYAVQSALGGVTIGGIGPVISGEGDVIKVPALARGGIAPRKMLAMIGERGREAVLPLENNTGWMDVLADRISARMGGASSTVVLEVDGREFGRAVVEQGNRENRRIGTRLVSR